MGYNEAKPLIIGKKIKLVWKGEPYEVNGVERPGFPAQIAMLQMDYKFLGGQF